MAKPHQVFIGERKLKALLDYLARPMHLAKAYLRATVTNEGDWFLPACLVVTIFGLVPSRRGRVAS